MRILVTGASGFIGRQTLEPLLRRGFEVHATHSPGRQGFDQRIQWHECDLLDVTAPERLCAKITPTHLLHLAWYVHPSDYKLSTENERWISATASLLRAFQTHGGKRAVLTGTCMEYDWSSTKEFLSETAPTASLYAYSAAKNITRESSLQYAKETGLSLAWGRIFNLYGPYEGAERLVPQILSALSEGRTPPVPHGGLIRDYSYVKDIAGAFAALTDTSVEGVINIASGTPVTLKDVAREAGRIMNQEALVTDISESISDQEPARIVAQISRLTNEVGWKSQYSLNAGLQETISWWQSTRTSS